MKNEKLTESDVIKNFQKTDAQKNFETRLIRKLLKKKKKSLLVVSASLLASFLAIFSDLFSLKQNLPDSPTTNFSVRVIPVQGNVVDSQLNQEVFFFAKKNKKNWHVMDGVNIQTVEKEKAFGNQTQTHQAADAVLETWLFQKDSQTTVAFCILKNVDPKNSVLAVTKASQKKATDSIAAAIQNLPNLPSNATLATITNSNLVLTELEEAKSQMKKEQLQKERQQLIAELEEKVKDAEVPENLKTKTREEVIALLKKKLE